MVNTAAEARAIVQYSRFPPVGIRGQGGPFAHFEHGLGSAPEYVFKANDTVNIMVQIETKEAVSNLEEICAVDGVGEFYFPSHFSYEQTTDISPFIDMIFLGPNDLSVSLFNKVPANWSDPEFSSVAEKIFSTAKKHGKKTGVLALDGAASKMITEKFGVDFIVLGGDVRALQGWFAKELGAAKA